MSVRQLLLAGIEDAVSQRAFKAIRRALGELLTRIEALEDAPTGGGTGDVSSTRAINTTAPLAGGGDLSADRTLSISSFSGTGPGAVPTSPGGTTQYLRADGSWATPPDTNTGEANTASNLGGGEGLFASKSGVDLRFKSLVAGSGVSLSNDADTVTIATALAAVGTMFLGDGSDGALNYNGVATVLGVAPAAGASPHVGSTTYTLTRDIFASSISISSGVVIIPGGYRIWCTGAITGPGKISRSGGHATNGGNGSNTVAPNGGNGAGGTAGTAHSEVLLGRSGAGGNGGGGGNPAAAGGFATGTTAAPHGFTSGGPAVATAGNSGNSGNIGQGGAGGGGGGGASGGTAGAVTLIAATSGPYVSTVPFCFTGRAMNNTVFSGGAGGSGGGGGGYSGTTTPGGGGGGGGGAGPLVVAAKSFTGGVVVEAKGGNGGNGGSAGTGNAGSGAAGGGGGGGGGAGSWAVVCYAEGTAPTVTVTGGTGGTGGSGINGGASGGNGGNGGNGMALVFNLGAG